MTKQEIKEAIAKGIAGQGTNVDGGGYLPKILEAIVDAIPEGGASPVAPEPTIIINTGTETFENKNEQEAADLLGITVEELKDLPKQLVINCEGQVLTRTYVLSGEAGGVVFGGGHVETLTGGYFSLTVSEGLYSAKYVEI